MAEEKLKPFSEHREEAIAAGRKLLIGGVPWRVYELSEPPYDRRDSRTLIFESSYVMRRVRQFPDNWRELADSALVELSEKS